MKRIHKVKTAVIVKDTIPDAQIDTTLRYAMVNQNKNRIVHIVGFMAYDNHGRVVPRANYCC